MIYLEKEGKNNRMKNYTYKSLLKDIKETGIECGLLTLDEAILNFIMHGLIPNSERVQILNLIDEISASENLKGDLNEN